MSLEWIDRTRLYLRAPKAYDRIFVPWKRRQFKAKKCEGVLGSRRRLLLDVSVISRFDAGTGIQRMVRAVINQLRDCNVENFELFPVVATRRCAYMHVVWNGVGREDQVDREVCIQPTDVFLGLDFATHAIIRNYRLLAEWKRKGARLYFIVHDLLPEEYPQWFSVQAVLAYRHWIKAVAILADGIFCNSYDTERKLLAYCRDRYQFCTTELPTRVLPMGWDISSAMANTGLPKDFSNLLSLIRSNISILMVGTLEPRKGHAQVLAAFENLWWQGWNCNLIVVGRPGWKTETLQHALRNHRQLHRRLFWLDSASDETLEVLYQTCNGVIIASLAEGYGLPMIEAIGHAKPIMARDLAVFREQAAFVDVSIMSGYDSMVNAPSKATPVGTLKANIKPQKTGVAPIEFFATQDHAMLAATLAGWLERLREGCQVSRWMVLQHPTWRDTADALLRGLSEDISAIDQRHVLMAMSHV